MLINNILLFIPNDPNHNHIIFKSILLIKCYIQLCRCIVQQTIVTL